MNTDLTQRLPPELLYRIFDRCGDNVQDILCKPGHVCSRWREIALRHPLICRDARLEGNLTDGRVGLFVTQLWAGMQYEVDVEITLSTGCDLAGLPGVIAQCLSRCVALNLEYYGTPDQLHDLCDALCRDDAPRLRVLELKLGVPNDWDEAEDEDREDYELFVIPSNLFSGNAPVLQTLKFACMAEWVLLPSLPIAAFRHVDTLELHHCWSGGTDLNRLVHHHPHLRHLYAVCEWPMKHAPHAPSAQTVAKLALESFKLLIHDYNADEIDAWLVALDLCRVPSVEIEHYTPRGMLSSYFSMLRGPLEVSLAETANVLSIRAPKLDRCLRMTVLYLNRAPGAIGECTILMPRVTRLELASHWWRQVSMLATSLPQTETLVLHLTKGRLPQPKRDSEGEVVEPVARIACPRVRRLVLLAPRSYCLTTADLAGFMRTQLSHEDSATPHLVVETRRVRIVGRRSPLQGLVHRIVQG